MGLREDMEINMLQPVIGISGTKMKEVFDEWIEEYGFENIHFIC